MQLKNDGYVLIKKRFRPEVEKYKYELGLLWNQVTNSQFTDANVIDLFKEDFDKFYGFATAAQTIFSLHQFAYSTKMRKLLFSLGLKFPALNTRPLSSISCRSTAKKDIHWKVPWHQDWASTQGSLNGVTCWVPLVDVNENLGALQIRPGSHFFGALDHKEEDGVPVVTNVSFDKNYESVPMKMGDMLIFSHFTVHRSGENRYDDRIRWSVHFRYNDLTDKSFAKRNMPRNLVDVRKELNMYEPTVEELKESYGSFSDGKFA